MARTLRAVARSASSELKLSQIASSRVRRVFGNNVKPEARLGQKPSEGIDAHRSEADSEDIKLFSKKTRGVTKERQQPGLESGVSPGADENHLQPDLSPSHLQETSAQEIPPLLEEVESPSQSGSHLPNKPLSAGAIGLDSPVPSPFFSSPFTVSDEGVKKAAIRPTVSKNSRLAGRKCLITGATSGIGYAIAKRFLAEGVASVTTVSRSQENIDAAYEKMKRQTNRKRLPFKLLLGDIADPHFRLENMKSELADMDILVNAAGISQRLPIGFTNAETAQQIIDTNLNATIDLCRFFSRVAFGRTRKSVRETQRKSTDTSESDLVDSGDEDAVNQNSEIDIPSRLIGHVSPCIINISSLLGVRGGAGATAYAASKAGVLGLTSALVCESASFAIDMRVNAIVPGYIHTPMTQSFVPAKRVRLCKQIPAGRFGTAEEVADAAFFLATNEYANNCVLNLDGGLSAV
ncbi:hypothetical protein GJ744_002362 [Endocarpon pusillum]|uniref:3-oxoacyl-acyl carrier protein reductase n=1 Tax=Endocarpon pusillum TaxID=364733 RepID=A0A8H7E8C7_9EURO|nr:hypothetical protein GJ744_002362 [Endocarpon pusillum]